MTPPVELSVFVSSPGDVAEERALAARVLDRLAKEFTDRVSLRPIFWEHEPLLASGSFQDQIVRPSDTDIVVCILWSRLGTRLPEEFRRDDGSRFDSGTEFEFEDALAGFRKNGRPHLLVYRKTAEPFVSLRNSDQLLEKLRQREALDAFIERWFHDRRDGTLRAAFHSFEGPDVFEETLEVHLRKLIDAQAPPPPAVPSRNTIRWTMGSPFRGLEPFEQEHADVFFGRTRAVSEAIDRLRQHADAGFPFLLILGMSGGGKSSLARAGILPLLTKPGVVEGYGAWRVAIMKPSDRGRRPFVALAEALRSAVPELSEPTDDATDWGRRLEGDLDGALTSVRHALATPDGAPARAGSLLLVDQLEEVFTNSSFGQPERQAFGRALAGLVEAGVWVVATMRSDFYPRLQEMPHVLQLKRDGGVYDLLPPTAAEIGQMIRQPVQAAGLSLEVDGETGARLEDTLRDSAVGRPGSLPLLEFTLEELYRLRGDDGVLTFEALDELGGVEGSLARRAEGMFRELPASVQAALPGVMRQLVTVVDDLEGGALGARLSEMDGLTADPASEALVKALIGSRLLTTDLSGDTAVVRIAHEALLRHWPRLRTWIEADRDLLKARERLRGASFRWEEEGRGHDLLLAPGKPLEDARGVRDSGALLSPVEEEFLGVSEHRARRATRLRRAAMALLVLLSISTGVVAMMARSAQSRAERETYAANSVRSFMVGLLDLASPRLNQGQSKNVVEILDWGAKGLLDGQLDDIPMHRAQAARALARLQLELGGAYADQFAGHERATELMQLAVLLEADEPTLTDSARAEGWQVLGEAHLAEGAYDSASHHLRNAAEAWRDLSPALEANALGMLAQARKEAGDMGEYQALMNRATELSLATVDTTSIAYAAALANHGYRLETEDRYAEAEAVLRAALRVWANIEDRSLPEYAAVLGAAARAAGMQGRYQAADSLYEMALEVERRVLPRGHEGVGITLNNAGLNAQPLGDTTKSERYLYESLETLSAALGPRHARVANVKNNLAELLMHLPRRDSEVHLLLSSAIATLRDVAPQSDELNAALQNYAVFLKEDGRVDEGIELLAEASVRTIDAGRFGDAAQVLIRQGNFELERERSSAARQLYLRAMEVANRIDHPVLASRRLSEIQQYLWDQEQVDDSEEAARQALGRIMESDSITPQHARTLGDMAFWHAFRERPDSATTAANHAIELLDDVTPVESLWLEANQSIRDALAQMGETERLVERDRYVLRLLDEARSAPEWELIARFRLASSMALAGDTAGARIEAERLARDAQPGTGLAEATRNLLEELRPTR